MRFSPDGNWIAASDDEGRLYVFVHDMTPEVSDPQALEVNKPTFSVDSRYIYAAGRTTLVYGETGKALKTVLRHKSPITNFQLTKSKKTLVVFGRDNVAFVKRNFRVFGIPLMTLDWAIPEDVSE